MALIFDTNKRTKMTHVKSILTLKVYNENNRNQHAIT